MQAEREVELLRTLDHPGVVRYHEHFIHNESLVVVMAYCNGGDLSAEIKRRAAASRPFTEPQVLDWFVQMVLALKYIHSKRILHRDLKTQNIFIAGPLIKLGDFGIAKVMEGSMAAASTVIGTPYYMSPEVCQNQPYGTKSDVWALGCILYEMCALQQAWNGSNLLGLVYKIVQQKYAPIPDEYSENLKQLVDSMLSKAPEARPTLHGILAFPFIRSCLQHPLSNSAPPHASTASIAHTADRRGPPQSLSSASSLSSLSAPKTNRDSKLARSSSSSIREPSASATVPSQLGPVHPAPASRAAVPRTLSAEFNDASPLGFFNSAHSSASVRATSAAGASRKDTMMERKEAMIERKDATIEKSLPIGGSAPGGKQRRGGSPTNAPSNNNILSRPWSTGSTHSSVDGSRSRKGLPRVGSASPMTHLPPPPQSRCSCIPSASFRSAQGVNDPSRQRHASKSRCAVPPRLGVCAMPSTADLSSAASAGASSMASSGSSSVASTVQGPIGPSHTNASYSLIAPPTQSHFSSPVAPVAQRSHSPERSHCNRYEDDTSFPSRASATLAGSGAEERGCFGCASCSSSFNGSVSNSDLTPTERMRLRKLAIADRRSLEIKQALSSSTSENRQVAIDMRRMNFHSNLSHGCMPSVAAPAPATSPSCNEELSGGTQRFEWPGLLAPAGTPGPASTATLAPICASAPPGCASSIGSDECSHVTVQNNVSHGSSPTSPIISIFPSRLPQPKRSSPLDATSSAANATISLFLDDGSKSMVFETDTYEDDFETYDGTLAGGELLGTTTRPPTRASPAHIPITKNGEEGTASNDALSNSAGFISDATCMSPTDGVLKVNSDGSSGRVVHGSQLSNAPPPSALPPPRPVASALQDRCQEALGDLFPSVYDYLKRARRDETSESQVRRHLTQLVGRERLNDCMWVDQLVFAEDMNMCK